MSAGSLLVPSAGAAAVAQAADDGVHVKGHQRGDDDCVLKYHVRHLRGSRLSRGEGRVCLAPPCDQQYGARPCLASSQPVKPCSLLADVTNHPEGNVTVLPEELSHWQPSVSAIDGNAALSSTTRENGFSQ